MDLAELNSLERDFLFRLGFRAHVTRAEYDALAASLGAPPYPLRPPPPPAGLRWTELPLPAPAPLPRREGPAPARDWVVFRDWGDDDGECAAHGSPVPPGPAVLRCYV